MKKLFTFVLVALMLPVALCAQTVTVDGVVYNLKQDGTASIGNNRDGIEGDVVIPSTITVDNKQYTVNEMSDLCFFRGGINSIILPSSITKMGTECFYDATRMKHCQLPEGLTEIPDGTFIDCYELLSIDLPQNINSIGVEAFSFCKVLSTIEIPAAVTFIGAGAFTYCIGLESVTCYATTPPTLGIGYEDLYYGWTEELVWEDVDQSKVILYVPEESVELYKSADQWKEFNVQPIKSTAISDVNVASSNACKRIVDGQVVIEKDGICYNVAGQAIK